MNESNAAADVNTPDNGPALFPATLLRDGDQGELALHPAELLVETAGGPRLDSPQSIAKRWTFASILKGTWHYLFVAPARLCCLIILLAFVSALPLLQLLSLGYLMEVTGRIGRGGRIRDSFPYLEQAGRAGMALLAIYLVSQPIRLVSYWSVTAELVSPGNPQTATLRAGAFALVVAGFLYLAWAWVRGGKLIHYLWPQPLRVLKEAWRPRTWTTAADRFWEFLASMRLPQMMWLGFRGSIGVLAWIIVPAAILIGATRNGQTGLAGLVGFIGFVLMGIVVMYLPMLQAQMSTENDLRAMFRIRNVRASFRSAPIAVWLATALTLLLAIPLYLLKIEAIPKEIVWLPSVFFVGLMLPAHVVAGWAWNRGISREVKPGLMRFTIRWVFRALTVPVVFFYLVIVYFSQLTSWDGLATWIQQHAFLVPVPFVGV